MAGSIYRHNEGGAPLAVAECAHKLARYSLHDCYASDDFRVWPEGWICLAERLKLFGRWFCTMAGSLKIEYRRKRNVGGRVLRNIARCSKQILWRTRFERRCYMRPDGWVLFEQSGISGWSGCKVYICSRRFKRVRISVLIQSVTKYSQYQIFNLRV